MHPACDSIAYFLQSRNFVGAPRQQLSTADPSFCCRQVAHDVLTSWGKVLDSLGNWPATVDSKRRPRQSKQQQQYEHSIQTLGSLTAVPLVLWQLLERSQVSAGHVQLSTAIASTLTTAQDPDSLFTVYIQGARNCGSNTSRAGSLLPARCTSALSSPMDAHSP